MKKLILIQFFCLNLFSIAFGQTFETDLRKNNCAINARINQYDTDRYNLLLEHNRVEISGENQNMSFKDSKWQITRVVSPMEKPGKYKVNITFKCLSGEVKDASVSVDFDFSAWAKENYVLLPAASYNGNRYEAQQMNYPPFFTSKKQMGLDMPIQLSDQPRLNFRDGYSRIQERSGSMSLPVAGFKAAKSSKGFWLCFDQGNKNGDYGVDIEENKDRSKATMTLTSPVVRELVAYANFRMDASPTPDKPRDFKAGDETTISFVVDFFEAPTVQTLYDELRDIRIKQYPAPVAKNLIPFSVVFPLIEKQKNEEKWYAAEEYYTSETGSWQVGWCHGFLFLYPLIAEGGELSKSRVTKTLNWLYPQGITPSGYYYDLKKGPKFSSASEVWGMPFGENLHLTRKNADGVYYAFKLFDLMKKKNMEVKQQWINGNLKATDAQLKTWETYGQLGQYVHQQTGEIVVGGTTSAGIFPAALCEAYRYTKNKKYLDGAIAIGDYYYKNYVTKGLTYGGPNEAHQSFDSESAYGLLEGYTELYETTGDKKWLKIAEEMSNQVATWVVGYDYKFPENSGMGKLGLQTTGTVYANTQNKHTAPGICTHSGISLLKLYRATGDKFYINLLSNIAHAIPQFMSWKERPIAGYHEGWISERINMTDWELPERGIGGIMVSSNWAENSMMLTVAELPGVYVNRSTKEVFVLDHVEAKLNKKGQLEITNPTPFNAEVKVLAETAEQMKKSLGQNSFLNWRKVIVPAGKTIIVK